MIHRPNPTNLLSIYMRKHFLGKVALFRPVLWLTGKH